MISWFNIVYGDKDSNLFIPGKDFSFELIVIFGFFIIYI